MSKLYLCGITTAGNENNLKELIEPIIDFVDGLQWTFHYPKDAGADYLESKKKNGEIVYAKYCQRHGFSMQQYLWQGTMQNGDYFIQVDDKERISEEFFIEKLPQFLDLMNQADLAMIANYGKGLIYRYNEQLEFKGSPHWYAVNLDGGAMNYELDKKYFWNVRNQQRDKYHWINHYATYFLFPAGSNHALLGLEKNGIPQNLFAAREQLRLDFRNELKKRGIPLTIQGVKELFSKELDDTIKNFINSELVWNNFYHFHILDNKDLIDNHDFKSIIKV